MKQFIFFILIALSLSACKTQNLLQETRANERKSAKTFDSAFAYNPHYQYVIRKDDKINLSVWGQDDLSVGSVYGIYNSNEAYGKWLMVDANGNIEVPKVGTVNVLNKTVPQVKDTLRALFAKWVLHPVVDVKVVNKEITILGEVRNPSKIPVDKDNNTLLEIMAKTGGYEFYAELRYVRVFRQEGENVRVVSINLTKAGDYLNKNIQLHPGDVVVVSSKRIKEFDKRISTIIPFATALTAATLIFKLL